MISKALAKDVLNEALATGGDYAEIYLEETDAQTVVLENGKVESCLARKSYGAGLRVLNGFKSVYGCTSDCSRKSLLSLAKKLAASFNGERKFSVETIKNQKIKIVNKISDHLIDVPVQEKIDYLKEVYAAAAIDERLVRIQTAFANSDRTIELFVAEGSECKRFHNKEERGRLIVLSVAHEDGCNESCFEGPARCDGWSYFKNQLDYKGIAKTTSEKALLFLKAKECPSGRYSVVIGNGWGGVLFHEACGHPLEASATAKGLSVFSGSIGKPIASPIVSAVDDGTIANEWGSNNIDSEGVPTHKNQLIKDGICVGYMVDRFNGRRLNMEPNGVSRRESYRYEPTSRMSNTYICPGKDKPEDIIKDTKLGIYVVSFGGGSVNPATGEFNFSASEAYIIRDGVVCEPVKGCTLIGKGEEILFQIDRVGNDLALGNGMCGAASGSIPVNVGQPTIRLKEITVGGRGGKLE